MIAGEQPHAGRDQHSGGVLTTALLLWYADLQWLTKSFVGGDTVHGEEVRLPRLQLEVQAEVGDLSAVAEIDAGREQVGEPEVPGRRVVAVRVQVKSWPAPAARRS